ncbi:NAD(P)-dependent dehydrogenase (short-subunit alcohol dehydrogenase family) [Rhizobium leguminosarum]|uniref:NAD(P)-dependent dehydrogenase (Short-subunit alcohol dehydrogenase family) n=1 Tax=Rhizobium leguminosarum TaxID=384 RepID=A0AAE2SX83_RHILE|nr:MULTISPECIES: SDR family oxidoreductase [Rhizobium]MBB4291521.1 NAD(P)-dependent dehydrogenase (short-subunit alcohol dehydrogenase family) [Rhizobium leguminosarum]MBB4296218.1 NAD(P)-dependent dehydrogenase (short-subunit alcohol dehydrogenase family) [Rhizobium leguminosarum]MBB4308523.1 NAD(P)-dependent dehydrogenase (short-subunit alcohol dehydrogenase family) [Rhizobium leguminosarum]MBB4416358.1 NAD(P)-dependent dehydrogenase (short-subunit alcohol dehydrogenase family) [Rhizobium leg
MRIETEPHNFFPIYDLGGQTVVIFGGTSGIGLATAAQAKGAGAKVIVIGSNEERAWKAAEDYGFDGWRAADVTRPGAVSDALRDLPSVDHLVMFAGSVVAGKVLEADVNHLERAFDERLWATVDAIRALGSRLQKTGSVTLISGRLADRPTAGGTAVLAAASAAMEALARGLALELAPIRVNVLAPGAVETPLMDRSFGPKRDEIVASMKKASLLGRLGEPADAASATMLLITNIWINGEVLHLDGGARLL